MKTFTDIKIVTFTLLVITGLIIFPSLNSSLFVFAETENPEIKVSEKLKNNPLAMQIIAEMEAQKAKYKELSEDSIPKAIPTLEQIQIENNRKISQQMLQEDLQSMNKKYIDFTPKNAFSKFVSKLNETYHGIFWDQFDYLDAKVQLAIAAKNAVLEDGGSYYEAQREYFKYASMPRLEMISYIQELNIKYGFADKDIQENFDPKGKLPRFENDDDAPCYGCESFDSNNSSNSKNDGTQSKINQNAEIDPKSELKFLQEKLTKLQQDFLKESDINKKKSIMESLNEAVKQIQELTYD